MRNATVDHEEVLPHSGVKGFDRRTDRGNHPAANGAIRDQGIDSLPGVDDGINVAGPFGIPSSLREHHSR